MSLAIRAARSGDGAALYSMIRELAVNHGHKKDFTASLNDYESFLGDPHAIIGAYIAYWEGVPAGCAIWQRAYSTFRGSETLYLEDLSVLPGFRRLGIARALLRAIARHAVARNLPAVSWHMMSWNDGARRLYGEAGALIEDGNCLCRLHGEALERLAT